MTPEEIAEIKARAEAATPGPWTPHDRYPHVALQGTEEDPIISASLSERPAEDIRFIAHSREDVPALLGEVERLREELGQLRLDDEIEQRATAGAYDEEDPY